MVEHRELRACDFGVPTIRKRFYLVARCDGQPITWPEPTHGDPKSEAVKSGKLLPWRTAAECIDFSLPTPSIFDRKKPLAVNTMQRVARGIDKFVIQNPVPFIVQVNHSGGFRGQDINDPLQTVTAKHGYGVVAPVMTPIGYGERQGEYTRATSIEQPLGTIVGANKFFVSMPFISKYYGGVVGAPVTGPTPTVTAVDHNALATAHLLEYYGNAQDGISISDPLHTVTAKDREGIVTSHLCVLRNHMDGRPITEPLPTITAGGSHLAQVQTTITHIAPGDGLHNWPQVRTLLNTHCGYTLADNEVLLFWINSNWHYISDIGLRMLEPRELYLVQGFPHDYIIDFTYKGKQYSKAAQVARCGNSVSPMMAKLLVQANMAESCVWDVNTLTQLMERVAI